MLIPKVFPTPLSDKSSWPWTEEFSLPPPTKTDSSSLPKISIVTPSFNQAQFLEETIRSVLLQGFPNLEYIIIDGGSTDGSVEIIKKYEPWLTYSISEPDRGQSHAINKGWAKATGDLIAYLNSDDTYFPGALVHIAKLWDENPTAAAYVGAVAFVDENSTIKSITPPMLSGKPPYDLTIEKWYLPQQSSFYNRIVLDKIGRFMHEDLHYSMDRELHYRLGSAGQFILCDEPLATYRFHKDSKSVYSLPEMFFEAPKALRYIKTGTLLTKLKRWRLGRESVGRGYFIRGKSRTKKTDKFFDFYRAAFYRPQYLISAGFWNKIADILGVLPIYRNIRDRKF